MTRRTNHILLWLIFTLMAFAPSTVYAQATPRSMESFLKLKAKWKQLAGIDFTLEGRYSSISGKFIRFQNVDLPFRSKDDLPSLPGRSRNAQVSGRIVDESGKLHFAVEEIRERPSDLQIVRSRQPSAGNSEPDEWYTLAGETLQRATFYEDKELEQEATRLYVEGLQEEYRKLEKKTAAQLQELAAKAGGLPIPDELKAEFQHEALRSEWDDLLAAKASPQDETRFSEKLAKVFPESVIPLESLPSALQEQYQARPMETYRNAKADQRESLQRLLYVDVVRSSIEQGAADDGSNGFEIAARLEKVVPELSELAEQYRKKELAYKMGRVGTMTRQEAIDFSKLLASRDDEEGSDRVLKTWVKAREPLLRRDGATGLLKLAEESVELLNDEAMAAAYLIDAWKLNPDTLEIAARLKKLGYARAGDEWLRKADAKSTLENDPILQAMREGRVAVGMSPAQVKGTLGAPRTKVRIATADQFSEVWVYGERTGSRLAVHFIRRASRPAGEAKVVVVSQTGGP